MADLRTGILQMSKMRPREDKWLGQGHMASAESGQVSNTPLQHLFSTSDALFYMLHIHSLLNVSEVINRAFGPIPSLTPVTFPY